MDDILKLAKDYSKKRHLDLLPHGNNNILENLDASRCNNSHGNVAARMNSINANIFNARCFTDVQTATARDLFDVASSGIFDKFVGSLVNKCRIHNVISFRG